MFFPLLSGRGPDNRSYFMTHEIKKKCHECCAAIANLTHFCTLLGDGSRTGTRLNWRSDTVRRRASTVYKFTFNSICWCESERDGVYCGHIVATTANKTNLRFFVRRACSRPVCSACRRLLLLPAGLSSTRGTVIAAGRCYAVLPLARKERDTS